MDRLSEEHREILRLRYFAVDATIQNAYQIIAETDSAWRAAAQSARFRPKIALPARTALGSAVSMCVAVLFLLVIRALPKLSDTLTWGLMLQGV